MKEKYELDYLSTKFQDDAVSSEKHKEEMIARWKESYPGEKLPDSFNDDFSLPIALKSVVDELVELRAAMSFLRKEFDQLHAYCTQAGWVVK